MDGGLRQAEAADPPATRTNDNAARTELQYDMVENKQTNLHIRTETRLSRKVGTYLCKNIIALKMTPSNQSHLPFSDTKFVRY